jgi:hypothetical protein
MLESVMPQRQKRSTAGSIRTLDTLRGPIHRIARKHGVRNVRVFGSFARGEQHRRSDIDLLVDLPDGMTLIQLSGLKIDLEETLERKVDVVTEDSLSPYLRERILHEARPL